MIFKNLANWSKKKCKMVELGLNLLQLVFSLVIPIIIVAWKYQLFEKVEGWKLTSSGLILVIIVAISGISYLNKQIKKLPEATLNERKVKYTIQGIEKISIPLIVIAVLKILKRNVETGCFVITWCMVSMIVSILIQYLFTEYVSHELMIYDKASEQQEINNKLSRM